jgi:hypothetical protein
MHVHTTHIYAHTLSTRSLSLSHSLTRKSHTNHTLRTKHTTNRWTQERLVHDRVQVVSVRGDQVVEVAISLAMRLHIAHEYFPRGLDHLEHHVVLQIVHKVTHLMAKNVGSMQLSRHFRQIYNTIDARSNTCSDTIHKKKKQNAECKHTLSLSHSLTHTPFPPCSPLHTLENTVV